MRRILGPALSIVNMVMKFKMNTAAPGREVPTCVDAEDSHPEV